LKEWYYLGAILLGCIVVAVSILNGDLYSATGWLIYAQVSLVGYELVEMKS